MKWIAISAAFIIMLMAACAVGQPGQFSAGDQGGAPTPSTPTSAESLGLQVPSEVSASQQAPTAQEQSGEVTMANQQLAYAASPGMGAAGTLGATSTYKLVVPPGGFASNKLYVSYAPQTVASCYLNAWLPLWMQTSSYGTIWFYEWYPNGMLDTNYAGTSYSPNWYKRWFYADAPGWHILQYYCNGWSNYVYIYVNSYGGGGYTPNPSPYPNPYPYPYGYNQMTNMNPYNGYSSYSFTSGIGSSTGSSYSNPGSGYSS